jgi:hypothetical protein
MSIERSFMRPKRASSTFTVTRHDCQINSDSFLFSDGGVGFRPIPCYKNRYRLEPENSKDNICTLNDLADEIRQSSGLSVNLVETVLSTLLDVVPKFIARTNGYAVRLGNIVTLKPCITGTIEYANGKLDAKKNHLEIRAIESPALRHALARANLTNTARHSNGLDRVLGGPSKSPILDKIDAENDITVCGVDIYVPNQPSNVEKGQGRVWVETRTGRRLGACTVLNGGKDVLTVRFVPDAPLHDEDRECRVVVETCGTKEAAESDKPKLLFRLSRDVTYIGPVEAPKGTH